MLVKAHYPSSAGEMVLIANDKALTHIIWKKGKQSVPEATSTTLKQHAVLHESAQQLNAYFAGKLKKFDIPIEEHGTEFQMAVWKALREIPYGETISYKELAAKIDKPKAIRAAGSANGKNPISIITPCHRVIATGGTLGGYAGGLKSKETLLTLEKARFQTTLV